MVRISGVDIPGNKQVLFSLPYIFGIGMARSQKIIDQAGVDPTTKVDKLTDTELARLREIVDKEYRVEGDLRKEISLNIKRLIDIGSYRGLRHRRSLPVRGQRTRTNARTKRGARKTVAGRGQKRGMGKK